MQKLQLAITERLSAEYRDFDIAVPDWLERILMDDVYYTVALIVTGIGSFGIGLCIGWICTLTL